MSFPKAVIRRTFIHIEQTQENFTGPKRSRSAPPSAATSGVRDLSESSCSQRVLSWSDHVSQWVETSDGERSTNDSKTRNDFSEAASWCFFSAGEEALPSDGGCEKNPSSFSTLDEDCSGKDGSERMKPHDKIQQSRCKKQRIPKERRGVPLPQESVPLQSANDRQETEAEQQGTHKQVQEQDDDQEEGEKATVRIHNVPCSTTKQAMEAALHSVGFSFDVSYKKLQLRTYHVHKHKSHNSGYALVCFKDPETAEQFKEAFQGYRFAGAKSAKGCSVTSGLAWTSIRRQKRAHG